MKNGVDSYVYRIRKAPQYSYFCPENANFRVFLAFVPVTVPLVGLIRSSSSTFHICISVFSKIKHSPWDYISNGLLKQVSYRMHRWVAETDGVVLLSLCCARPGSTRSRLLASVIFGMKRTHTEASKAFVDPPLCSACGQVEPASRYAARVNKKRAYWRDAHQHDIAALVRVTVPEKDLVAALRQKNAKEIGAEVFPSSPSPSPSEPLLALRYTLDLNELHHRHIGDLIEIIDEEIARASDPKKRSEEVENKLQQIFKARSEDRRALRARASGEKKE